MNIALQPAEMSSQPMRLFRPTQRLERLEVFLKTLHVGFQVRLIRLILLGPDSFRLLCIGRHYVLSYVEDTLNHERYYGPASLSTPLAVLWRSVSVPKKRQRGQSPPLTGLVPNRLHRGGSREGECKK